ncbi:NHLP leader peptide family RiPP precursor [Bradyrhizobium sp. JYMT SZCCT0428]|uniref:NHLP leader peptide family RiPP precursor n=1 Tax=Bradyrhizobium sp. JYMT SZCCT0428 TaxID=2807673 RepID=UPI001BA6B7B4|nr:NHLP leader peptide family RiPP precursor [Bradyrhizobium sp. JYMT SZCCT0428]MBR1153712.1 NHLP leader peptide family RiPP precursor [Bradyrhizobium sp. JYMT SZCCT0428]
MAQTDGEWIKQWSKIVEKAWHDESYKNRLKSDPETVLKEEGIAPPEGVQVKLVENTPSLVHLTLPAKIVEDISEKDLETVAGGHKIGGIFWGGTHIRWGGGLTVANSLLRFNR